MKRSTEGLHHRFKTLASLTAAFAAATSFSAATVTETKSSKQKIIVILADGVGWPIAAPHIKQRKNKESYENLP